MATALDMRQLVDFIKQSSGTVRGALAKALLVTSLNAERYAKQNAQRQFIGRNDRRLSGALLNSIYSGVETSGDKLGVFVGVRNIPYGAIHEFGGDIVPKNAKNLWIPQYREAGKMTPREFIQKKIQSPGMYFLNDKVAGKWANPKSRAKRLIPLFFLTKHVKMPERPYLRPAMELAVEELPDHFERFLDQELSK